MHGSKVSCGVLSPRQITRISVPLGSLRPFFSGPRRDKFPRSNSDSPRSERITKTKLRTLASNAFRLTKKTLRSSEQPTLSKGPTQGGPEIFLRQRKTIVVSNQNQTYPGIPQRATPT